MNTSASPSLPALGQRYSALQLRLAALRGREAELRTRQGRLTSNVALAKGRLELAPRVAATFEYLQDKAHARAVGDFEDLLSAFVEDVVPESGKIHLELGTERGAPALDIFLDNGGDLEDIYSGNGGGVTNVVVTALGFSALSRTRNRQIMLLDEPDCWLKSVNVPAFTKVIAEVSNPRMLPSGKESAGCQTLMISHNDVSLMDDGAHLQNLSLDTDVEAFAARMGTTVSYVGEPSACAYVVWAKGKGATKGHVQVRYRPEGEGDDDQNALTKGFPFSQSVSGPRHWADDATPGVRWIEVENLRHHVKTRLPLSSGLNVLTGGVNTGKSTLLFTALRALAYGESDDSMIRHGADQAVIRLGLEAGVVLEMVRNRKGSPKVLYRLYADGAFERGEAPAHEGSQEVRSKTPAFIREALRIETVDDMDIQLRHQKQPVFLLNESAARRARLLSVGKESGLLSTMITRHGRNMTKDRETVKTGEVELNEVNRSLTALTALASLSGLEAILTDILAEAQGAGAQVKTLAQSVAAIERQAGKAQLGALAQAILATRLTRPTLIDSAPLARCAERIERNQGKARLQNLPEVPHASSLADTARLARSVHSLAQLTGRARLADTPKVPVTPILRDTVLLEKSVKHLESMQCGKLSASLRKAPIAGKMIDTTLLRSTGGTLSKGASLVRELQESDAKAQAESLAAQAQLQEFKDELGVCPLCQSSLAEGHNHAHKHTHSHNHAAAHH